jgi:nucleoside-diphosphate-sugar epimerase
MKVLFIGGTGKISSACTPLAADRGFEMYLLNRGQTNRPVPPGVTVLNGDIRDRASATAALAGHTFDVVVDWIAFTPEQVETDLALFKGRVGQYIFISSASAYQTPPASLPATESTPLDNPYWLYSRNKIACEELLLREYRDTKFPMTIVRPSHTYDKTLFPFNGGYTTIHRMRQGKPVVIHGDGTSLWTMTHHTDFAKGFVGLLGNSRAIGDAFHITSDEWLNWNQIYEIFARAAGVANPTYVHIPSDLINAYDPILGAGLLGDKTNSMIFDNSKIKRLVPDFICTTPLSRGAEEVMVWYDADPARQVVDQALDQLYDRMLAAYQKAWPNA